MKRFLLSLALLAVAGSFSLAQISGTAHNLTGAAPGLGGDEICLPCHAPHNASTTGPLWNHNPSVASYTLYGATSATFDAADQAITGVSALCMSCHDNTVALGGVLNNTGSDITNTTDTIEDLYPLSDANLGIDLSNDHPVSFTYDDALVTADGGTGLNDPDTGIGALQLFGAGSNQLECATCHDVHDNTNAPFLVMSNASSALCLTCHTK